MKLSFSRWKILSALTVCILAFLWALPSFLPNNYASWLPKQKVNLGLDLRGGAYILLETDVADYLKEQMRSEAEQLISTLHKEKIESSYHSASEVDFTIKQKSQLQSEQLKQIAQKIFGNRYFITINDSLVKFTLTTVEQKNLLDNLMTRSLEIIRRRIDESGTKEIELQRQGLNQILLQVPGLQKPSEIENLLGKTAKLTFHLVTKDANINDLMQGKVPGVTIREFAQHENGQPRYLPMQSRAILTGEMLIDAQATVQNNLPVVSFKLNALGARIFSDISTKYVGQPFAIVLDDKVLSAPVIREPIHGGAGIISGNFTLQSANELALLLRAGALPAPIKIVEERIIGPSLGNDSIEAGKKAVAISMVLVMSFMLLFYGWFGMLANFALLMNLVLIIAILALFGATLTLPGIAGIVLTLGMAVDANVLIFERIREEVRKGRTALNALASGFDAAFVTIVDSNFTTVLAAVILYIFGTGAIRGFAVTLTIGILSSMFTAVILVKMLISIWYRWRRPSKLII